MNHSKYTLKNALGVNIPLNGNDHKRAKDFSKALRQFTKAVKDSGRLTEYTHRKEYTKPTTKRREARKQAIRNARREQDW
jgi:ribosomal protein S21